MTLAAAVTRDGAAVQHARQDCARLRRPDATIPGGQASERRQQQAGCGAGLDARQTALRPETQRPFLNHGQSAARPAAG